MGADHGDELVGARRPARLHRPGSPGQRHRSPCTHPVAFVEGVGKQQEHVAPGGQQEHIQEPIAVALHLELQAVLAHPHLGACHHCLDLEARAGTRHDVAQRAARAEHRRRGWRGWRHRRHGTAGGRSRSSLLGNRSAGRSLRRVSLVPLPPPASPAQHQNQHRQTCPQGRARRGARRGHRLCSHLSAPRSGGTDGRRCRRGDSGCTRQRAAIGAQAQRCAQRGHGLEPVLWAHRQARVHRRQGLSAEALAQRLLRGQRLVTVVQQSRHRRRRRAPGDGHVQDGAQGIDIGPGALGHVGHLGILLDGRIAGLEDHRNGLGLVGDDAARGAEVQHHRQPAAFEQQDVVGGNVAVVALGAMHDGQGLGDAVHHRQQPGFVHVPLPLGQGLLERVAPVQRHHHVGGALFLPEAVDLQQ